MRQALVRYLQGGRADASNLKKAAASHSVTCATHGRAPAGAWYGMRTIRTRVALAPLALLPLLAALAAPGAAYAQVPDLNTGIGPAPSANGPVPPATAPTVRPVVPPAAPRATAPAVRPPDGVAFGGGVALPDLRGMTPQQRRAALARLSPEQRALLRQQRRARLEALPPGEAPPIRRRWQPG